MNKGERAELKFIATLGCYIGRTMKLWANDTLQVPITSIQVPINSSDERRSINALPTHITPTLIAQMTDDQLSDFCISAGIEKAGPYSKSDVYINGIGHSIKFTDGAPPALINHTNRLGWEFAATQSGANIQALDLLIDDYWIKRVAGTIREDVANSNADSPFSAHIATLKPFLNYFCFDGSGKKVSDHPATNIVEFSNPCDISTWIKFSKADYIDTVWPNLVFSLRSKKGMPPNIDSLDYLAKASVLKWSRNHQGSLRGALHVRFK